MLDRRGFLGATFGLAVGIAPLRSAIRVSTLAPINSPEQMEYESILANCQELDQLGLPRNWLAIRQGLHPFVLERVIYAKSLSCHRQSATANARIRKAVDARLANDPNRAVLRNDQFDVRVQIGTCQ